MSTPSTFARQRRVMPYSKLYADVWRQAESSGISDKAKLFWVSLQSVLVQSDEPGYLIENGLRPTNKQLAIRMGKTEAQIEKYLEELLTISLLTISSAGVIFDPRMVADQHATHWETNRKRLRETNGKKSGTSWDSHDIKNKSKIQEQEREEENCAASSAISDEEWLNGLKSNPRYAGINVELVIAKCQKHCKEERTDFTRARAESWLKTEQPPIEGLQLIKPKQPQEPERWQEALHKLYPSERELQAAVAGDTVPERFGSLPTDAQMKIREYLRRNTLKTESANIQ
jgi:hypothetical protein